MYKVKAIVMLVLLACVLGVNAQEIKEKTLALDGARTVHLKLAFGDNIMVKGWDKNEVYVKTSVEINGGKLNKALKMTYYTEGDEVVVKSKLDHDLMKTGKKSDCTGKSSKYSATHNGTYYYACYKITYEVMMPRNAKLKVRTINNDINLDNLLGDLKINTVNGSINMETPSLHAGRSVRFSTVNGKIDLTMSDQANTYVKMSTVNGKIYSHFDVPNKTKNGMRVIGGNRYNRNVKLTLGNGEASARLSTVNGRIYLRKSK